MLKASIDIGSNSILLLVARVEGPRIVEVLESESEVTALGSAIDTTGSFSRRSMNDSLIALEKYKKIISRYNIPDKYVIATATEASRVAKNSQKFYKKVRENIGITVNIITAKAEAYFSTEGILLGTDKKDLKILDIGGASTEITHYKDNRIQSSFSMPFGSVRATDWCKNGLCNERIDSILNSFKDEVTKLGATREILCVAGTMTSVANIHLKNDYFIENDVHGHKLSKQDFLSIYENHRKMSDRDLEETYPFLNKRSKTIVGGMLCALKVIDRLGVNEIEISTYGLRHGTLIKGEVGHENIYKEQR